MSTDQTGLYTSHPFDETAVSDALAGGRPYLSPASRQETIRRLDARGHSTQRIAQTIGCDPRTVDRAKARIKAGALPIPSAVAS